MLEIPQACLNIYCAVFANKRKMRFEGRPDLPKLRSGYVELEKFLRAHYGFPWTTLFSSSFADLWHDVEPSSAFWGKVALTTMR